MDAPGTIKATAAKHVFTALQYLRKVCNHPLLALHPSDPSYSQYEQQAKEAEERREEAKKKMEQMKEEQEV